MNRIPQQATAASHLLIVGGGRDLQTRLRRRFPGRCSVMCSVDLVPKLDRAADNFAVLGVASTAPDEDVKAIVQGLHGQHPITHIACWSERDQERYAMLAKHLELPGPEVDTILSMQDKALTRARLKSAGVDTCLSIGISTRDEARDALRTVGLPAVIKPRTGVASRGVTIIHAVEDVDAALDWGIQGTDNGLLRTPSGNDFVVEPYLGGKEYTVDSLSEGGQHVFGMYTEKINDCAHFVEYGHLVPAPLSARVRGHVEQVIGEILDALGVHEGHCHTEFKIEGDRVHLIETHHRPAGDFALETFCEVFGVDMFGLRADQICGDRILDRFSQALASMPAELVACIGFAAIEGRGVLRAVEGINTARNMPGVIRADQLLDAGHVFDGALHSGARAVVIVAVAGDSTAARARVTGALSCVQIVVEGAKLGPALIEDFLS